MRTITPFLGQIRRAREFAYGRLIETRYEPNRTCPIHAHPHPYLCFVLAGRFTETPRRATTLYQTGWVIFRAAGEPHETRFGPRGARCLMVELKPDTLTAAPVPALPATRAARSVSLSLLAARLLAESRAHDAAAEVASEGYVLATLAEIARSMAPATERAPFWLRRVEQVLRDSDTPSIPLNALAAIAGVDRAHLCRAFQAHFHCTVGEFVRRTRVERAARELVDTNDTIGNIAHRAGYCDQSHFTREFRRRTGVTPAAYRRLKAH